jgi:hypothetical protein
MHKTRMLALVVLALTLGSVSSVEARKWRWWQFHDGFNSEGNAGRPREDNWRARQAEAVERARARTGGGAFGAVIDRLIRGCAREAAELKGWPFDQITRIVVPDDAQRAALETLRASVSAGAERLSAECPQDAPAPPWARLEAVEQAIEIATSTFAAVEPPLRAFYAALDDEQKARLLRDLTLSGSHAREGDRAAAERSERRNRRRADSGRGDQGNASAGICEHLTAVLRGWPIREIERGVRLSEQQRIAFYELVSSSLKAADLLAGACPVETAITPPSRMALMRARLSAVRQAAAAIRPALTEFYEALDQGQKVRFAAVR